MSKENGGHAFPSANEVRVGDITTTGHAGMTLRDYFATKAPVEIPMWFEFTPATPCPETPKLTLTREQYDEWDEIGAHEQSAPEIIAWDEQFCAARKAQADWNQARDRAHYFAWRWAYADAMLAERNKPTAPEERS